VDVSAFTASALNDDDSGDAADLVAPAGDHLPTGGGKDGHGRKPGHEHYGHDHK
jgi:trigger factor